jgi:hypothetical protein
MNVYCCYFAIALLNVAKLTAAAVDSSATQSIAQSSSTIRS